jgi:hypothetical protein
MEDAEWFTWDRNHIVETDERFLEESLRMGINSEKVPVSPRGRM